MFDEQKVSPVRDARGAVFVEKLIVYLPLLACFFLTWELAEVGAAKLVVQRASAAAGRAAVVVLPDDPARYDGEALDSYSGARRADIELAAGMILSAIPRLNDQFTVEVSDPPAGGKVGPLEVSVSAEFDCGAVSFFCGDGAFELASTTVHTYQGAKYEYTTPSDVGGGASALTGAGGLRKRSQNGDDVDLGGTTQAMRSAETCFKFPGQCAYKMREDSIRKYIDAGIKDCSKLKGSIQLQFEKLKDKLNIQCVSKQQAIKELAKDKAERDKKDKTPDCACPDGNAKNFEQSAKDDIEGNKCRAFTNNKDEIFLIAENCGTDTWESDLLHETIHVMSGPGGKTPIQGKSNQLNEAVTQFFTEIASKTKVQDAYTEGDAGEWMKCLKKLDGDGFQAALCEAYFKGDSKALLKALIAKFRSGKLGFMEKKMTDAEITEKIEKFDLEFWKKKICF